MNVFLISDTHFGHAATFEKFKRDDGTPLRPFTSVDEMNETMIDNWNKVVKPDDRIYHLGDVSMSCRHLEKVGRCNGRKVLIAGNHDPLYGKRAKKFDFAAYFEGIVPMKVFDDMIMTHVPVHPGSIGRFGTNVHGHLHGGQVMWEVLYHDQGVSEVRDEVDPRYLCVSVEHTNYTPLSIDEVRLRIQERQDAAGYKPPQPYGNGSAM